MSLPRKETQKNVLPHMREDGFILPWYHLILAYSCEKRPRRVRSNALIPYCNNGQTRRSLLERGLSVRSSRNVFAEFLPTVSHQPTALLRHSIRLLVSGHCFWMLFELYSGACELSRGKQKFTFLRCRSNGALLFFRGVCGGFSPGEFVCLNNYALKNSSKCGKVNWIIIVGGYAIEPVRSH